MTKMTRVPIAAATDEQLRDYCDVQQLELTNTTRSGMIAALATISDNDYILASDPQTETGQDDHASVKAQTSVGTARAGEPIWIIEIGETEMIGGKDPVPVSVNGRAVVLQRNMLIELPHRYKVALDLAVRETVEQDERSHEITTSRVRAYPMMIHERPTQEATDAWEASVADVELGRHALRPESEPARIAA